MILWGRKRGQKGQKRGFVPWSAVLQYPLPPGRPNRSCRLLDALEDLDDVRSVTSTLEADEALMEAVLS